MVLPVVKTFVIAAFVQAICYGVYVMTLIHSLRWLLYEDDGWKVQPAFDWRTLSVTLLLFIFSTVDLGVSLRITFALISGQSLNSKKLELTSVTYFKKRLENLPCTDLP
jgi:hypothetical protein